LSNNPRSDVDRDVGQDVQACMDSPTRVTPVIKPSDLGSTLLCELFELKEIDVSALLYTNTIASMQNVGRSN
jgi:hypothetical protein